MLDIFYHKKTQHKLRVESTSLTKRPLLGIAEAVFEL